MQFFHNGQNYKFKYLIVPQNHFIKTFWYEFLFQWLEPRASEKNGSAVKINQNVALKHQ